MGIYGIDVNPDGPVRYPTGLDDVGTPYNPWAEVPSDLLGGAVLHLGDARVPTTLPTLTLATLVGLTVVPVGDAPLEVRASRGAAHLVIVAESVAAAGTVTATLGLLTGRPRPYVTPAFAAAHPAAHAQLTADNADLLYRSFPSGHTATAAALYFSVASVAGRDRYVLTGSRDVWVAGYVGAGLLTAGTGVFRVVQGVHYPTDVLVGALHGASLGVLIPLLHHHGGDGLTVGFTGRGLALSGTW